MEDLLYLKSPARFDPIRKKTAELSFPMASEPLAGALLRVLAASKPGGRFLELGTGTGVATAWILDGMDAKATLISVDTDGVAQAAAREVLGSDARLTLEIADGAEFLRRQTAGSFDMVFADAMPGKYEALADALAVVKLGGFYVIDDLLPNENWPKGHVAKVPKLMETLAADVRFQILPLVWASGVMIAVRSGKK
jgi:predicted O-methyltransferase YrrM